MREKPQIQEPIKLPILATFQRRCASGLAAAMNLRDGSILDSDSMKEIQAMMDKFDGQAWVEVVGSNDPTALVLEDGALKE